MNEQSKKVETILNIKKELMLANGWHDYLVEQLNKVNTEIPLLEEELTKEMDEIKPVDGAFDSAQSASDMLGMS